MKAKKQEKGTVNNYNLTVIDTKKYFFCQVHKRKKIVYDGSGCFALECGCAYRVSDIRGVQFINTTDKI